MEKLTLVKVGGKVLENEADLTTFIQEFCKIEGKKVLVHGGGVLANQLLRKIGIDPKMIEGRRVTDKETLDTVIMVYGGLINKKVVAKLVGENQLAVGLTGADGLMVESVKRPAEPIDYGYAGDVIQINNKLLLTTIQACFIPVVAPLSISKTGQILNTNADTIATELAINLSEEFDVTLIYGFEMNGVMKDVNNARSLVKELTFENYQTLKTDGKIHSGMIPKLDNAFSSIKKASKTAISHFTKIASVANGTTDQYTEIKEN